jgi:hypothetical protein
MALKQDPQDAPDWVGGSGHAVDALKIMCETCTEPSLSVCHECQELFESDQPQQMLCEKCRGLECVSCGRTGLDGEDFSLDNDGDEICDDCRRSKAENLMDAWKEGR